jgi:hypothetical protein
MAAPEVRIGGFRDFQVGIASHGTTSTDNEGVALISGIGVAF